ncbi:MAG TPA: translocation/assembly module TamB domain-containing protein [Terracidiphilus sp.]|nr:translocation/assembly module TamB domain-containing protein [Terracidiphilus sp.]
MTTNPEPDFPEMARPSRRHLVRRLLTKIVYIASGLIVAAVLTLFLIVTLLNVDGVHRYLLRLVQKEATSAIGVPVTLENARINIPALRVDLYGIGVGGAAPYRKVPLLQVSHIEITFRIISVLHFRWYLNRLQVDHPVIWIVEGKDGRSNLPARRSGSNKSNTDIFSLAIRHAAINRGELYLNDRPQDINADLSELDLHAAYNTDDAAYKGTLAYKRGRIQIGALRPLSHNLEASFSVKANSLQINRAMLASGKSKIVLAGDVNDLNSLSINARYEATIDAAQIAQFVHNQWVPAGVLQTSGTATYHRDPKKSVLSTITLNGKASSGALVFAAEGGLVPIRHVTAQFSVGEGAVRLPSLQADALGGKIAVEGVERVVGAHPGGDMRVNVRAVELQDAENLLPNRPIRPIRLVGTVNGTATASWGAKFSDLITKVDATMSGEISRRMGDTRLISDAGNVTPKSLPLSGRVEGTYLRRDNSVRLANTFLRTPETTLVLSGAVAKRSSLAVQFRSSNLSEMTALARLFTTRKTSPLTAYFALAGQGSFQGNVTGSLTAPTVTGHLEATQLNVDGTGWKAAEASVALSPSSITIEKAYLAPESEGVIQLSGHADLDHWSLGKASSFKASLTVSKMKLSDFVKVTKRSVPVAGTVNATLHLSGSTERLNGNGRVQLADMIAYGQPITSASATLSAEGGDITANVAVDIAGAHVSARATVNPEQRWYKAQVTSSGVPIQRLEFVKVKETKARGILAINAKSAGTFENPELNGYLRIANASIEGHPLPEANLQVNMANKSISANFSSTVGHAPIRAHATVALSGGYSADVSLDTETVSLQPLLALYSPDIADEIVGQTEVHLRLHGPLKDRAAISGSLNVPVLSVTYKRTASLAAAGPINIGYEGGNLRIQPVTIRGTDTNLRVQGMIPLSGDAPLSLVVQGDVNLQAAQLFDPEMRSAGTAYVDLHSGSTSSAGLAGQIDVKGASVSYGSVPIGLSNGNGILILNGNRIDIAKFNGNVGGGTITAQGGVALRPKLRFDMGMTAKNVRMIYPQGMWENVDASLRFTGNTERALMAGTVAVSDLSFTPAFDLTSMLGQFSTGVAAPTSPGFSQNLLLNIALHSTSMLNPVSRTMSVAGTAALTIRGTAAHPALIGRVSLTGGSMIFNGDRFVLTGGTIQFVDPNQFRPVLNLSLTTTVQQYDIDLRFTGPVDQIRGEFTSNPSLPRADVISLLAFGRTTEAQTANPTPANQAAESMIASQVSNQVTSRISKIAGISQLSISPVLTSGTAAGPPGAVITIRQQVTGNLFITFSTNVASTQDQTVQGQYKLSPRVSVSATRDPNGGFAIDTLIRKSW